MNLVGYVLRDLVRNPRRTLASLAGVVVGVGLFSAVLFFIDGSGASMTQRAIAPLSLDVQRVLTAPLGGGVELDRAVVDHSLSGGEATTVSLTISNPGLAPAHEVVIRDRPPAALAYVLGSTRLDGTPVTDVDGAFPMSQGPAGIGLNIGTVAAKSSHRLTYKVTAAKALSAIAKLPSAATVSTREAVTPTAANAGQATPLAALDTVVGKIRGVGAADPLVFVDLSSGSISAQGSGVPGPVKLFAFDADYQAHFPSIKMLSGRVDPSGALISAETASVLGVAEGDSVQLSLPGRNRRLSLTVSGITDLSGARPLFESRESSTLENFVYVPFTIVVGHKVYREQVAPAFEKAAAARDSKITSLPLEELDISVDRSTLNSDPASAVAQTSRISAEVEKSAPGEGYLIDNISNTLKVARGDADIAKRMFVFLGLPGVILAAILTGYAGTLLAESQRRENALLRVRGAGRHHLLYLLTLRTVVLAGIGSVLGTALGFASVLALLGRPVLFAASPGALLQSGLIGIGAGMLVTALALYVPGRRLITDEIKQELAVISRRAIPRWRRLHLDVVALAAAAAAQLVAVKLGAFDVPAGSVYSGQSVTLPLQLLIAPIVSWLAGSLLISRLLQTVTARVAASRRAPGFTRLLAGVLWRSMTRRLGAVTSGVVVVGLVVGLGTMLASFATVYDTSKSADSRFVVGSDIRLTPNPTSGKKHPTSLAKQFEVGGVGGATAVVFSPQNSVLTSKFNEDVATLAAIEPTAFTDVGALQDSLFVGKSASDITAALTGRPNAIVVNSALAEGLKLKEGDDANVLLGRGTDQQTRRTMRVVGLFTQFPGAPKGTDIVANLDYYQQETGLHNADYYLVSSSDHSTSGVNRTVKSLSRSAGFDRRFDVQTTRGAFDKDQSSLTGLNVRGLLHLDSFFTFVLAAIATAMFVFGLLLQRRREYVTLRAQGLLSTDIRRLVLAESTIASAIGTLVGLIVGVGMASQFVLVLRPIFTLPPVLEVPVPQLGVLAGLVLGATALSSAAAAVLIARLKPTELLRDE